MEHSQAASDLMDYAIYKERTLGLLKECLEYVKNNIDELGGCDHSVGICMCGDISLADRLAEAIKKAQES